MTNMDLERKLAAAILMLKAKFPFHADLLAHAKIALDDRIRTACVFPSGRILLSPTFIKNMTHAEVAFIIEHEIYHIYYKTNDRSKLFYDQWVANVAHDLIINGELVERFGFTRPPNGGLHWPDYKASVDFLKRQDIVHGDFKPIKDYSFEEMVALLTAFRKNICKLPKSILNALADAVDFPCEGNIEEKAEESPSGGVWDALDQWSPDKSESEADDHEKTDGSSTSVEDESSDSLSREEKIQQKWIGALFSGDAKSIQDELEMFPSESPLSIAKAEQKMKDLVREVAARKEAIDISAEMAKQLQNVDSGQMWGQGQGAGANMAGFWNVQILRGNYSDSWEMALQAWIDESAPPMRSWARASRRGAERTDVVLPGRNHIVEGWMLNIVLDVSGSMWDVLPVVLGHIQAFGISSGVKRVRLVESVEECRIDNIMDISELSQYKMPLADGSDLCPCMLKLAEDPSVQSVLILTDGYIDYPSAEEIPYDVVWGLTEMAPEDFPADYGIKIAVRVESDD
ncbi:MAG: hypothetical protein J6X49_08980 [Victivallales bacterium]|nr:hypothetical protein [Victivallales bacterium]